MEPRREQAHLPAEQPPPCEDPRLPAAHAHPRRPRDPVRAPPQGPQRAVGLTGRSLVRSRVVLPAAARLRRREDFTLVVRRGRRAGSGTLVVHYLPPAAAFVPPAPASAGFVVSRAVGGSVDRHRVVRRLRHLVRARLDRLPLGGRLVVRALAPARDADSDLLAADLDAALDRVLAEPVGAAVPAALAEPVGGAVPAALAEPAVAVSRPSSEVGPVAGGPTPGPSGGRRRGRVRRAPAGPPPGGAP